MHIHPVNIPIPLDTAAAQRVANEARAANVRKELATGGLQEADAVDLKYELVGGREHGKRPASPPAPVQAVRPKRQNAGEEVPADRTISLWA